MIHALAAQQYGLITRSQVLSLGGTVDWLRWAVRDGRLIRVRQGVYALAGFAPDRQALMSACLAGGPTAAASHYAAASLWGAEQVNPGRIEITTFDNCRHRLPGVVTHRSRLDAQTAIRTHLNLPVVVPPLTVVQMAATCQPHLLKTVANDLVKRNWTTFQAILEWIDKAGYGRQQALREMCLRAIEVGGHYDSPAARELCEKLIRSGAEPFEIDYQVVMPDGTILLIDIAWPRPRVGIEYNGARDHERGLGPFHDSRRHNRLLTQGWRILDANRGMTHKEIVRWVLETLAWSSGSLSR